jgi:RNA polymerase sigma-70 factor (ECF subfamily)
VTAEALMCSYCDGDQVAFRALYELTAPRIYAYLKKLAKDRATAEDLLQQTYLKLHDARGAYVRGANPMPWLFTIAYRVFLDEARRARRSRIASSDERVFEIPVGIDGRREQSEATDSKLHQEMLAAIEQLPARQREVVRLTKVEGLSTSEAARILGTTAGAVKLRMHRAYQLLRAWLAVSAPAQATRPACPSPSDA